MTKSTEDEPPDLLELAKITLGALGKRINEQRLNGEISEVRAFASALERKFDSSRDAPKIVDPRYISRIKAMVESLTAQAQIPINYVRLIHGAHAISKRLKDIPHSNPDSSRILYRAVEAFLGYRPNPLMSEREKERYGKNQ